MATSKQCAFVTEVLRDRFLQCGLDTSKKVQTPIHEQEEVFRAQLELGKELQRPISVMACYSIYAFVTVMLACHYVHVHTIMWDSAAASSCFQS